MRLLRCDGQFYCSQDPKYNPIAKENDKSYAQDLTAFQILGQVQKICFFLFYRIGHNYLSPTQTQLHGVF